MRRADRLFQIVQILRRESCTTATELASELECSDRTIYRDIRDLIGSGVPIDGEAGVGYSMARGFDLPPMMFDRAEIEALILGLSMVESWADTGLQRAARNVLGKVANVLPEQMQPLLEDPRIHAIGFFVDAKVHFGMDELRDAMHRHRKCWVRYEDAAGKGSERVLWPLGLYFWRTVWTLAAWCELREDYRTFRLDRLLDLRVLDEEFVETDERGHRGFVNRYRED